MTTVSRLTCCILVCASACAEDGFPLPPIVWEGEMVRVRMDDEEIPVCGGTFEALDTHAGLVREALLLEGRDRLIEYSIGDKQDFIGDLCGSSTAAGCAHPESGQILASAPFIPHEIVHAVRILDPRTRFLSSPIEEGLATVFGSDIPGSVTIDLNVLGLLEQDELEDLLDYYRAGHVVAMILQRYGTETFREFELLARERSEDEAFLSAFGETKEEFAEISETMPVCQLTQWWMPVLECSGEPEVRDPETGKLVLSGNISCGDPDVVGPNLYGVMWTSRHFEITERTHELSYEFDFSEDVVLEIVGCNPGCPDRFTYSGGRWDIGGITTGLPALEPGEYFLRMSRPISSTADDGRFEVVL